MPRYAAFLRAINVSGRRITNADLCAAFARIGFADVSTFRASGNVVFDADDGRAAGLAARIEKGLGETLGYAVPTFVRTAAQVRAIAGHAPFEPGLVEASAGKLQVVLLGAKPKPATAKRLLAMATSNDRLELRGSELLWLPSGGLMDSGLDLDAVAGLAGPITVRTKGTIDQIAAKFFA